MSSSDPTDGGLTLQIEDEEDAALAAELSRALTAHNMAATGVQEERTFSVKIDGEDGDLVAGLTGWTWGECAGIDLVWVRDDRRGAGLGAHLLLAAEAVAAGRGCNRIFVSSFTFQAPRFYERHGYREIARIEDLLAIGAADVWFVKPLALADAGRASP